MYNSCLIILATNAIFIDLLRLTKLHVKLQPLYIKDVLSEGKKRAKTQKLCIIMLINPSQYNLLEKNIFDL